MARWASLVEKRRSEKAVLMIDGGDFSLAPNTRQRDLKERYFFEAMKLLRYDAIGIGECEVQAGIEGRLAAAKRYGLPLVNSNVIDRTLQKPVVPESIIRDIGGAQTLFGRRRAVRVGIFSVILPSFLNTDHAEGHRKYSVIDPKLSALATATNLRTQGCDLVIAVSHLGWQKSLELAGEVPGIDIVLNGHRAHKKPYEERVGTTVVVDAGEKERTFTELSVTFEGDSLIVAAADVFGEARTLREDPRLIQLQKRCDEEIRRSSAQAAKKRRR